MKPPLSLMVKGTFFYLTPCTGGLMLIDAGWELERFEAEMKARQIAFHQIRWVMFTHHHPDHAGLVQAVRTRAGAKLIIHEKQIPYLEERSAFYHRRGEREHEAIRVEKGDLISPDRAALQAIGIRGEILETPGHSPDSVSLLLDTGEAFVGDLTAPNAAGEESIGEVRASWQLLIAHGARVFYHSHAGWFALEQVKRLLEETA